MSNDIYAPDWYYEPDTFDSDDADAEYERYQEELYDSLKNGDYDDTDNL